MIDPVSIGIAFTVAQKTVSGIKQAIALGKDINSLAGQFARFFENCDTVHSGSVKLQEQAASMTDGQIRALSIQTAMQSKALRDAEKQLKDFLIQILVLKQGLVSLKILIMRYWQSLKSKLEHLL